MPQLTSPAGRDDRSGGDAGFSLIEILCVLAILAILAALIVPALPRGTSRAQLEALALATAGILKADRTAAIRRRTQIATQVNAAARLVRSGATGRSISVPEDVVFDSLLASRCKNQAAGPTIRFFASGMSCGGVIALTRSGQGYEVRVNWFTGEINIVPRNQV